MRAVLAAVLLVGLAASACSQPDDDEDRIPHVVQPTDQPLQPTPSDGPSEPTTGGRPGKVEVSTLVQGLAVPWGVDFLPDGAAIVTERDSKRVLRITPDGDVTPVGTIEESAPAGEGGLLGVAVSPDFDTDSSVFLYTTTGSDNRVLRATLDGDRLGQPEVVLDGIPQGFIHDGGRIAFGPDGFLYVSTGEVGDPELAQDRSSLGGKILRLTPDGDPAPGNPDEGSPVWSYGHRNVQGLAWDDEGRLWASEFGDSTWDELNLVEPGNNYGWPEVEGTGGGDRFVDPKVVWPTDQASPSGLAYLEGSLWMAGLRGQRLWQIPLDGARPGNPRALIDADYGRLRTVVAAPDGSLWVTTSNRDGRGQPAQADDRILRVTLP
jgi:glucose/arabinose dehydrogenase